jgi:hypothetical protein
MRRLLLSLALFAPLAYAGPECTTADASQWQDQGKFQEDLKALGQGRSQGRDLFRPRLGQGGEDRNR